ncbi:MAG: VanZ family protein [Kiritimatiellae bacterium]|jgi:VanZ family protein|nr:VanZ family protein [Kiritimatiellia bacterium]
MRRIFKYLPALLCSVLIPLLSLINPKNLPDASTLHFAGMDKVGHLLMYAALTSFWLYPISKAKRQQLPIILGVALMAGLYGAVLEMCQLLLTSSRNMEALDAVANLIGAMIAAAGFYFFSKQHKTELTTDIPQTK